jgi:hypothetical protein
MARFAELDLNNKVLRVVVGCNQDIANNGGEQSEQAAEHFKTVSPLSENGVKWVQTSYNGNFRKQHAGINYIYDLIKDKFISPQPHQSWSLDNNDDWQAPIPYPITYTLNLTNLDGTQKQDPYIWNEVNQSWDLQSIS